MVRPEGTGGRSVDGHVGGACADRFGEGLLCGGELVVVVGSGVDQRSRLFRGLGQARAVVRRGVGKPVHGMFRFGQTGFEIVEPVSGGLRQRLGIPFVGQCADSGFLLLPADRVEQVGRVA